MQCYHASCSEDRTRIEIEERARAIYQKGCITLGIQTFKPQPHVCTPACDLQEVQSPLFPSCATVVVCKATQSVHICDENCSFVELTSQREGWVCPLTGLVKKAPVLVHELTRSKKAGRVSYTNDHNGHYMDRVHRYNNGKRVKPLKKQVKRATMSDCRIFKIVSKTIENVLCAPSRVKQKELQMTRFFNETTKIFRSLTTKYVDVIDLDMQVLEVAKKFGAYLNPPLSKVEPVLLKKLTRCISKYYKLFVEADAITFSPKTVTVFTAVICDKFSTGWVIKNKVVIPQLELFAKHAPPEIAYSSIKELDIVCRAMSSMKRNMQSTIIGSTNCAPKLKYFLRIED